MMHLGEYPAGDQSQSQSQWNRHYPPQTGLDGCTSKRSYHQHTYSTVLQHSNSTVLPVALMELLVAWTCFKDGRCNESSLSSEIHCFRIRSLLCRCNESSSSSEIHSFRIRSLLCRCNESSSSSEIHSFRVDATSRRGRRRPKFTASGFVLCVLFAQASDSE
mmetsp:Transcript_30891/g.74628  ORF Transcript_30891/g.74628 Transcript_30891/m.74628 type:complete len:162 (+) Transcript_30891:1715-2200(+)